MKAEFISGPKFIILQGRYAPAGAYVSMHCGGHDADERRFVDLNLQLLPTVYSKTKSPQSAQRTQSSEASATFALRSGKATKPRRRTRMTRIQRISTDPRASASTVAPVDVAHTYGSRHTWRSAQSAFHHVCSSLKNPASGVSAFIRVHPRFFKNVIFHTGLTGSTGYVFNPVYPVIMSNLKCLGERVEV